MLSQPCYQAVGGPDNGMGTPGVLMFEILEHVANGHAERPGDMRALPQLHGKVFGHSIGGGLPFQ